MGKQIIKTVNWKKIAAFFCVLAMLQSYISSLVYVVKAVDEELTSDNRYCNW
jgi:hypothetical protein